MHPDITISFMVTPSQKESIYLRTLENGFDDIPQYVKVVALKTKPFNISPATAPSNQDGSIEIAFKVTQAQKDSLEALMQASEAKDLSSYLTYVALHGIVNAVIEVRSTGNLSAILERIAKSKSEGK